MRFLGWLGVILINCQTIPGIIEALQTGQAMPISQWVIYVAGMFALLCQAIKDKDFLYIVSNGSGLLGLSILGYVAFFS